MVSVVSLAKSAQSESEEGWVPWKAAQGQGQTHEMNYNDMHSSTAARLLQLGGAGQQKSVAGRLLTHSPSHTSSASRAATASHSTHSGVRSR